MPWLQGALLPPAAHDGIVTPSPSPTVLSPTQQPQDGPATSPEVPSGAEPPDNIGLAPSPSEATPRPDSPTGLAERAAPQPTATVRAVAPPQRLIVPAIGVDAPVIEVGVAKDGAMETPRTAHEVGWYGPRPGEAGNALLTGHVDWTVNGVPTLGSFFWLHKLQPGDEVTVRSSDGVSYRFRVVWTRLYDAATAPVPQIAGPTDQPSVTLITCGGQFDRSLHSYDGRWVVRAVLESGERSGRLRGGLRAE